MYRVDRNNFYTNEKNSVVYTPEYVSNFIYGVLTDKLKICSYVLDPCVGTGSLLHPFSLSGCETLGIDICDQGYKPTMVTNYLSLTRADFPEVPDLVIMNPPFNLSKENKDFVKNNYGARQLLPEVWLKKTISLFGIDAPMVLFTPYGFRLNQTRKSKRWVKFISGEYPKIDSIVSLPKDCFSGVLFHSEILFFNVSGLDSHYFVT